MAGRGFGPRPAAAACASPSGGPGPLAALRDDRIRPAVAAVAAVGPPKPPVVHGRTPGPPSAPSGSQPAVCWGGTARAAIDSAEYRLRSLRPGRHSARSPARPLLRGRGPPGVCWLLALVPGGPRPLAPGGCGWNKLPCYFLPPGPGAAV